MSRPWYAAALPDRADAAWELYHENSKRDAGDAPAAAEGPARGLGYAGLPELTPATAGAPSPAGAPTAEMLLALLAAGGRPLGSDDPTLLFVAIATVAGLPPALAIHDPAVPCLRLLRDDLRRTDLEAALPAGTPDRAAPAIVFLAADLEAATARAGERGYRDALIAIGRHVAALEAAPPEGLVVRAIGFHDRAADALLHLDGLARSVLAAVAIGAADDRGGGA